MTKFCNWERILVSGNSHTFHIHKAIAGCEFISFRVYLRRPSLIYPAPDAIYSSECSVVIGQTRLGKLYRKIDAVFRLSNFKIS